MSFFQNYGHNLINERRAADAENWSQFCTLLTKYAPLAQDNSELRLALLQIAKNLGIDPFVLHSASKDDHKAKVAVLCTDFCRELWSKQGGSAPVAQIEARVNDLHIEDALEPAEVTSIVAKLGQLGPGFRLETLPSGLQVVCNASTELSHEQGDILAACDALGYVTTEMLSVNFGWPESDCQRWLDLMLSSGLLWADDQSRPRSYWAPGSI